MVYYEEEKVNFSIVEKNACLNEGKWDTDAALKGWCEVFGRIDSFEVFLFLKNCTGRSDKCSFIKRRL